MSDIVLSPMFQPLERLSIVLIITREIPQNISYFYGTNIREMADPDSRTSSSPDSRPEPLQEQAIQLTKAAFSSLSNGDAIFQQCLESSEPIPTIVQELFAKYGAH